MKKFLFYLGHPAHWHYLKNIVDSLSERGHKVLLIARKKDVLLDLLEGTKHELIVFPAKKSDSKLSLIAATLKREWKMFGIAKKFQPDVMIGTDIVITHIGKLLKIPSIVMSEDDAAEIKAFVKYGYKYATHILAPASCDCTPYNQKQIAYNGYAELNYLHPTYFTPNKEKIAHLFGESNKYFIFRFAHLSAFHDDGRTGISNRLAEQIIELLKPHGQIHITSERKLPDEFEPYRIKIHQKEMHHALAFADMYIGDSQTMAAEAAILGTPSLRFNDFVGKLGYLEELEHTYGLTKGIPTNEPDKLLLSIQELLADTETTKKWAKKRATMLEKTIDVNQFMLDLFEGYPDSVKKHQKK